MLQYLFSLHQFLRIKCSFFIHSTMPYIHSKLDSRIGPIFSDWCVESAFKHDNDYKFLGLQTHPNSQRLMVQ